jgi:putative transposase
MEHATRRILHVNVTAHPTAPWTLQQLRGAIASEPGYRFLMHDRDSIFSQKLDEGVRYPGLRVLKTTVRSPQAKAICERLLGTLQRECLDFMMPLTEHHLRHILTEWVPHDSAGCPHMALGPGIPQPPTLLPVPLHAHRHRIPEPLQVVAYPVLSGLRHEYRLEEKVA